MQYENDDVLLHEDLYGQLFHWRHVSAIVSLDYRRSLDASDYACTVLLNPWAYQASQATWFPYGRVLELVGNRFVWHRGAPSSSTFEGAQLAAPRAQRRTGD